MLYFSKLLLFKQECLLWLLYHCFIIIHWVYGTDNLSLSSIEVTYQPNSVRITLELLSWLHGMFQLAQAAIQTRTDRVAYKKQMIFLIVQEPGKPQIKISADSVSAENLHLGHRWPPFFFFFFFFGHRKGYLCSLWPVKWALISFARAPLSWPNYISKAPTPNTNTLWVRISKYEFWRTKMFSL